MLVPTNVRERMLKAEMMCVLLLQAASRCFSYTVPREEPLALTEKLGLGPVRVVVRYDQKVAILRPTGF